MTRSGSYCTYRMKQIRNMNKRTLEKRKDKKKTNKNFMYVAGNTIKGFFPINFPNSCSNAETSVCRRNTFEFETTNFFTRKFPQQSQTNKAFD